MQRKLNTILNDYLVKSFKTQLTSVTRESWFLLSVVTASMTVNWGEVCKFDCFGSMRQAQLYISCFKSAVLFYLSQRTMQHKFSLNAKNAVWLLKQDFLGYYGTPLFTCIQMTLNSACWLACPYQPPDPVTSHVGRLSFHLWSCLRAAAHKEFHTTLLWRVVYIHTHTHTHWCKKKKIPFPHGKTLYTFNNSTTHN